MITLAVVDDDEAVRTALARLLHSVGHNVSVFASAEEFEKRNAAVDCVIADVGLPGASGLDLRDRLRSRSVPIPVVLISGDPDTGGGRTSTWTDTPSISKPFDGVTLMAAIAEAMRSPVDRNHHG